MIEIVPLELKMYQFRSHYNTVIDFGKPGSRVFINGESGSGKTTVLYAFQYLLGMDIDSYDDFFHQEGEEYATKARLELNVFNKNFERNHIYDKTFWIVLDAERNGEKTRTKYTLRYNDGRTEPIYKEKLKEFGDWNDPFMFVPDDALTSWVKANPKERYKKVMQLIGVEELYKKLESVKKSKKSTENSLETHEKNFQDLKKTIEFAETEFQFFQTYHENLNEIQQNESHLYLVQSISNLNKHKQSKSSFLEDMQDLESNNETITKKKQEIKKNEEEKENIKSNIANFEKQKEDLKKDLEARTRIKINLEDLQNEISNLENILREQDDKGSIENILHETESFISELNANKKILNKDKIEYEKEIKSLEQGEVPISIEAKQFKKLLENEGIECEFLFNILEIKDGMEKWSKFVESHLKSNKFGILVQEKDLDKAYQLNIKFGKFPHPILGIKNRWKRGSPLAEFKNWIDIIEFRPSKIPFQEIENLMNRIMGSVYFIEDLPEREEIFTKHRGAMVYCLDNFIYLDYKQEKFRESWDSCIGEKGKQKRRLDKINELEQINNKLRLIDEKLKVFNSDRIRLEEIYSNWKSYEEKNIKIQKIFRQSGSIENNKQKILELEKLIDDIKEKLRNPQGRIETLNNKNNLLNSEIEQTEQSNIDLNEQIQRLQIEIEITCNKFIEFSKLWLISIGEDPKEYAIEPIQIKDEGFSYPEIPEDIYFFVPKKITFENPENIQVKINLIKEQNEKLSKMFSDDIEDRRNELLQTEQLYKEEIEKFKKELDDWNNEMLKISGDINKKIENWRESIQSNFRLMMKGQKMDGTLKFTSENITEGDYELEFIISSKIGGISRDKMKNFSKGERTRISFGFLMAILKERSGSFFIWDEFDPSLDEDKKERLADLLYNHIPGKSIIISPQTPIKKYIEVFDRFIIMSKDANEHSIAKYYDPKRNTSISTLDSIMTENGKEKKLDKKEEIIEKFEEIGGLNKIEESNEFEKIDEKIDYKER